MTTVDAHHRVAPRRSSRAGAVTQAGETPLALPDLPSGDLSWRVYLGLPLAVLAVCALAPLLGHEAWSTIMLEEFGLLEIATVVMLIPAIAFSILIFRRRGALPPFVGALMLLGGLAAFYFAGEEASWGQHYFGYATPEAIAANNDQGEFNLHNTDGVLGGLFDQGPRALMFIGCLVGGVILPFLKPRERLEPGAERTLWYWIIPTRGLAIAALLAVTCNLPGKILESLEFTMTNRSAEQFATQYGVPVEALESLRITVDPTNYWAMTLLVTGGELKELFFSMVMLLFLWSAWRRARRWSEVTAQNDASDATLLGSAAPA
ncbi:MAG: hypothetical protein ACF8PN_08885 [Phycisphaerales bacterium]